MKYLSDKRIRLIILTVLIVVADFFNQDPTSGMIVVFIQAVLAIMLIFTIYSMIMDRFRKSEEAIKNAIGRFIVKLFGPMSKRMIYGAHRKSSFVVGDSRLEFIGGFNKPRRKSKRIRQKKIDINNYENNADAVRRFYIRYILSTTTKGKDYTLAETPLEIKAKVDDEDSGVLFDSYVEARYGEKPMIDDGTVDRCRLIVE